MRLPGRHLLTLAAVASAAAGLAAFGCSLGLDPSLIGQEGGAGTEGGPQEGGSPGDAGDAQNMHPGDSTTASDAPVSVDAGACNTNADCQAAAAAGGACIMGPATCDPTAHVCVLDVCGNSANCQAEVCGTSQTCTLPATYGFAPTRFPVSTGGVGGYGVGYAIAAAWPVVFVVTNNGLAAFNVSDPTNPMPPQVTVQNVAFLPDAAIAVGRRVYFVQGTRGSGPMIFHQAIAWIDVPQNALLTTLTASSAFVSTTGAGIYNVFSNDASGLFMVYTPASGLYPTANAVPPFDDTTVLTPFPNTGLPGGAGILATTGGRLLTYRYAQDMPGPGYPTPHFGFVDKPGTSMATTSTEQSFTAFGALDNQYGFATGGDGSVIWETAVLDENDAGGNDGIATARLSWLVDSASAGNFDSTAYVDLATYSPPAGGQLVGQPAWMSANTALGFAALSSAAPNTTLVQVVTKTPASIDPVRNTPLPAAPGSIGVATSNGFAYALLQNDPMNQTCAVQIIAPSCGGADQ
jgi:hypothetical protein